MGAIDAEAVVVAMAAGGRSEGWGEVGLGRTNMETSPMKLPAGAGQEISPAVVRVKRARRAESRATGKMKDCHFGTQ